MHDPANAPADDGWDTITWACRTLICSRAAVFKLADAGQIGIRRLPYARPKVRRSDVLRLAASSTRPAVAAS